MADAYDRRVRVWLFTAGVAALVSAGLHPARAQSLLGKASVQYATVLGGASAGTAAPGSAITIWADITPNPSMHIYARGAKDVLPIALAVTANPSVTTGAPKYPTPDVASAPGSVGPAPAYARPFRIALPVTVKASARAGEMITLGGTLSYQACDDRVCYAATAAPVTWTIAVR